MQPAQSRKIAGLAFQFGLESPTTTPVSFLNKQLQTKGIDVDKERVDLSNEVMAPSESVKQWAARKALVEYSLREPLEYQGTSSNLIRKTDAPDISALLSQMTGGGGLDALASLGEQLGLPEFKRPRESTDWTKKVCEEAERDGFCGVLIVRLDQSQLSPVVNVDSHFYAMESAAKWFEVKRFQASANAQEQTKERIDRLKLDPQIKTVLETLSSLGLQDQSLIDKAFRHGAATQQALERATAICNEMMSKYTRTLASPPVELP
jgi:hypothetical protein